jgi:hypothetical protein
MVKYAGRYAPKEKSGGFDPFIKTIPPDSFLRYNAGPCIPVHHRSYADWERMSLNVGVLFAQFELNTFVVTVNYT